MQAQTEWVFPEWIISLLLYKCNMFVQKSLTTINTLHGYFSLKLLKVCCMLLQSWTCGDGSVCNIISDDTKKFYKPNPTSDLPKGNMICLHTYMACLPIMTCDMPYLLCLPLCTLSTFTYEKLMVKRKISSSLEFVWDNQTPVGIRAGALFSILTIGCRWYNLW